MIGFLGLLLINTVLFVAGSILQHQLAKAPDVKIGDPQFPTVDQSKKLPVIFGTVRLTLNVFRFGKMHADPITIRQNTSLITYHTPTVAFAYHWWLMGWLCYGRISSVLDVIFEGNKPLMQYGNGKYNSGTITRVVSTPAGFVSYEEPVYTTGAGLTGTDAYMQTGAPDGFALDLYAPDLFGGVDPKTGSGQGGVVGRIRVYNGNGEHNVNAEMQAINAAGITPGHALYPYTEPAYPDWAYVVFENLYMGTQPQCPQVEFVAARAPVFKFGLGNPFIGLEVAKYGLSNYTYRYGGANPAALLAEILLNDEWGKGYPRDLVDMGVLAVLYDIFQPDVGGDGFHLCGIIDGDMSASDALAEVLRHLDGVMYLSPVTGKISFMLLRGKDDVFGYGAVTDLPLISPANASSLTWGKASQRPSTNELVVEFANIEKDFLKDSIKIQNVAAIQAAGRINTETVQYMWITGKTWAAKVGQRDLRTISQDFAQGEVEMNRAGMKFHVGQWVRLTWPEYNLTDVPCRVGSIDPGSLKDGKVKLSITEDYWSTETPSYKIVPPTAPIQDLQPYRNPTVDELYLADTLTKRVLGLNIFDPDNHVTLVEFFVDGALIDPLSPMLSPPHVITINKSGSKQQLVCYTITYTGVDGTDQTISSCFAEVPAISSRTVPQLSFKYVGTDVLVTSNLPGDASGIKFAWAYDTPPSDADVWSATPDLSPPFDITIPAPTLAQVLYVRASAWDGIDDSAVTTISILPKPTMVTAAFVPPTAQFPFGNGAVMGAAGDWLAVSPDFIGSVLRWKVRFLNNARAQVTTSATFSVKKVRESDGALIDMVGGVLSIVADDESAENGASASGWTVPAFAADDELIVTLESLTNPNNAVSALFTLTLAKT